MVNRGCVECVVYARGPAAQSKLALKVAVGNAAHTSSRYAERPSNLGEAMALRAMGMAAARAEYYQYGAADEGGHRSTAQKKKNLGFAGQSIGRDLFGLGIVVESCGAESMDRVPMQSTRGRERTKG
ncbi:hypothetical protein BM221_009273 [Beauveria bassiana]|uniref:Uncharacterized protein n=1 Tax=Beauveria bassiana TaxID=176275 RepID=A0A2N6NCT0_BEABA|nr:hypothetical protein BM221_009273 [Beauveria bassiana]